MALSTILFASEIMEKNEEELKKLHKIENSVYRTIPQQPLYTVYSSLREIGASSIKTRHEKKCLQNTFLRKIEMNYPEIYL